MDMNTKIVKPLALILCASLIAGSGAAAAYAAGEKKSSEDAPVETKMSLLEEKEPSDAEKNETVYVLAGADGTVQKIIVSDWIKNNAGAASLTDSPALADVESVKGDATYTVNGDGARVWNAAGGDVYAQGTSDAELPVGLRVSYRLDGKSVSAEELAGKNGVVTIRFDYDNRQSETVEIDGKQEKIYVPFAMLTGILLDNDVFTNVTVTNGKLVNDGDRTAVIGIAFPGLPGNLNLKKEKLDIPEYVEITADVQNFRMTNTVTLATNGVFSSLNTEKLDYAASLTESLDRLSEAMAELMDGSSALYDGLCTLLEKSGELISGIDQLAAGAEQLRDGAKSLSDGASALADGTKSLAAGLAQLDANSASLSGGAKQVFDTLLAAADAQLAAAGLDVPTLTVENYAAVLDGVSASLNAKNVAAQAQAQAKAAVAEAVAAKRGEIRAAVSAAVQSEVEAKVTAAVRENVEMQVLAAMGMTKEAYDAGVLAGAVSAETQAQLEGAVAAQMESETVKATAAESVQVQMASAEVQALIEAKTDEQSALLIEQNLASDEVQTQICAALERAQAGAASIASLKAQLNSYNTFYNGVLQYTACVASAKGGADRLNAGAGELRTGSAALYAGADTLLDGILTMQNGAPVLTDGITQLRDGAMQLSDGLKQLNEEGIQKLIDAVDGDLASLSERLEATVSVSKDYKSYAGLMDGMDGEVKFIYRTDAVGD